MLFFVNVDILYAEKFQCSKQWYKYLWKDIFCAFQSYKDLIKIYISLTLDFSFFFELILFGILVRHCRSSTRSNFKAKLAHDLNDYAYI